MPIPENLKDKLIINARWEIYTNFLDAHSEYDKVFVTDVRDVIFQGDIFNSYTDYKNFLAYSTVKYDYKTSGYDSQWFRNIFSDDDYQKVRDKLVICCGMVFGTRAELRSLCVKMTELLKDSTTWGDEQAAMNFIIYNKLLPIENILESNVETGAFINLGVIGTPHIAHASENKILREDGGAPAVVHQWTGYDYGINFVNRVYRQKEFQPDENFTDTRCALEQVFCLVQVKNWSEATKYFMKYVFCSDDLNVYAEKFPALWQNILDSYTPQDFEAEILTMTLQKIVVAVFSQNLEIKQLDKIWALFFRTKNLPLPVNTSFKNWLNMSLWQFANIFYRNKIFSSSLLCIARIFDLGLPISAEVHLLQAENYRMLGQKAEALTAYKNALGAT